MMLSTFTSTSGTFKAVAARSARSGNAVGAVGLVWTPTPSPSSPSPPQPPQSVVRLMSSSRNSGKKLSFRPRRRPSRSYRPLDPQPVKVKGPKDPWDLTRRANEIVTLDDLDDDDDAGDDLNVFGRLQADAIRFARRTNERNEWNSDPLEHVEDQLRFMDYYTSAEGSTEDLVGERRGMASDLWDFQDRDEFSAEIERLARESRIDGFDLEMTNSNKADETKKDDDDEDESENLIPESQLAYGQWGEVVVSTDIVRKMWRGGRVDSFRSLVIAGNLNGCGGYGVGKAFEAEEAVEAACREARRNLFFVDRYRNRTLSHDLVGRQNSCKVQIRSTREGSRGNPLVCEILELMGITDVVAKAHGNRNPYNVVRATYKALLTHQSLEQISKKRGVRLVNLEKAKRLQV